VPRDKKIFEFNCSKFKHCFSLHESCFPDIEEKVVLEIKPGLVVSRSIDHILVLEPFVECNEIDLKEYLQLVENFIDYFEINNLREIHYKYHPSQSKEVINEIEKLFSKSELTMIKIEQSESLERLFIGTKPNVYHCASSVGIYAVRLGCKVFSQFKKLSELSLSHKVNHFPKDVKEEFIYL